MEDVVCPVGVDETIGPGDEERDPRLRSDVIRRTRRRLFARILLDEERQ